MSARLASQSTILPLPSSPHWAPMTVTFPTLLKLSCCAARAALGGEALCVQLQRAQFIGQGNREWAPGVLQLRYALSHAQFINNKGKPNEDHDHSCDRAWARLARSVQQERPAAGCGQLSGECRQCRRPGAIERRQCCRPDDRERRKCLARDEESRRQLVGCNE